MKPVSPVIPGENFNEIIVAENQPEYQNLPVIDCGGGVILSRWKLTDEEKRIIAETGDVYLFMHTFGRGVTPVLLQVEKPETSEPQTEQTAVGSILCLRKTTERIEKAAAAGVDYGFDVCGNCGLTVIASKVSLGAADAQKLQIICTDCAQPGGRELCVLPETVQELRALAEK